MSALKAEKGSFSGSPIPGMTQVRGTEPLSHSQKAKTGVKALKFSNSQSHQRVGKEESLHTQRRECGLPTP